VVETDGLENRCTLTGTGGSNPSPSAISLPRVPSTALGISARGSDAAKPPQLENRCTLTGTGGSNPSPSAITSKAGKNLQSFTAPSVLRLEHDWSTPMPPRPASSRPWNQGSRS
jgi:hypothetical protein